MGSSSSVAFPVYFDRPVACWTLTPLLQWRDRVGFAPSFPIILVANWLRPKEPVSTYEIVISYYYTQILPYFPLFCEHCSWVSSRSFRHKPPE